MTTTKNEPAANRTDLEQVRFLFAHTQGMLQAVDDLYDELDLPNSRHFLRNLMLRAFTEFNQRYKVAELDKAGV